MKKLLILGTILILSSCAELEKYTAVSSNATAQEKFRACALIEAQNKFNNGTLFSKSLSATKDEIVNSCLKKMALEAAGIDAEAQSITLNIINNLKGIKQ